MKIHRTTMKALHFQKVTFIVQEWGSVGVTNSYQDKPVWLLL